MPNIRPAGRHAECWRLDYSGNLTWWGQPGDVKICPHGRFMMRMQVPPNHRMQGPGTDYWQTLSPIFNPIKYQLARKALA